MNTLKITAASIIAILSVVCFLAFGKSETTKSTHKVDMNYFEYIGEANDDPTHSGNWKSAPGPLGCSEGSLPCFVETEGSIEAWLSGKSELDVISQATARRD